MSQPEEPTKKKSDLGLRFVSAIILGPIVLGIIYLGGLSFAFLGLVAAVLFLWEWYSITGTRQQSLSAFVGYMSLVAVSVCFLSAEQGYAIAVIVFGALAVYAFSRFSKEGRWAAEGVLYSGLALFSLLAIRNGSGGLLFTFFLIFVVWATDIFAYFVGRRAGGPKLWARVSPKKTWSGAIGGLVLAVVFGVAVAALFEMTAYLAWALLAAALSVISQAGDLLESAIKRRFDVKDSSQLIPGHGGIMDRIDGLVAAAILAVLIGLVLGGTLSDPIAGIGLS